VRADLLVLANGSRRCGAPLELDPINFRRFTRETAACSRAARITHINLETTAKFTRQSFEIEMLRSEFLAAYNVGFAEVFALLVGVYYLYKYVTRDRRRDHLPPHVRGWPIINQTFAHLEDDPTPNIIGWAKEYGEIFRTTAASTTFIWLNSREAFKELIDRRSAIYSSRHPQPMTLDVASAGKRITFMPYGKDWRALRNLFHRVKLQESRLM